MPARGAPHCPSGERDDANRLGTAIGLAALVLGGCGAGSPPRPPALAVTAGCTNGIYGGGTFVELRASGEVWTHRSGPDHPAVDSLVGRDGTVTADLLRRVEVVADRLRGDDSVASRPR